MLSNLSPKESNGEERLIGAKGLGFKSVLNWAEKIELQSNNIKLTFGTEQAMFKWKELKRDSISNKKLSKTRKKWPSRDAVFNLYFEVAGH